MTSLCPFQLSVDSGLLVLIWLVQLIIYPSFLYTTAGQFLWWHNRYTGLISIIVSPLMLLQAGFEISLILSGDIRWQRITLISATWLATVGFSVPCHKRMQQEGWGSPAVNRLITTNWIRTATLTLLFLDSCFAAFMT